MAKACIQCGGPLPIQTGRGRRRQKCPTCSPSRAKKSTGTGPRADIVLPGAGLLAATRAELEGGLVLDSAAGQAALLLAARIERNDDRGSAIAQMVRQLNATLARALATSPPQSEDPVERYRGRLRSV